MTCRAKFPEDHAWFTPMGHMRRIARLKLRRRLIKQRNAESNRFRYRLRFGKKPNGVRNTNLWTAPEPRSIPPSTLSWLIDGLPYSTHSAAESARMGE